MEQLLEFIPCDCTTGEALCHNAIEALTGVGLDVKLCRSQTMDGAGNMKNIRDLLRSLGRNPERQLHIITAPAMI